MDNSTEKIMEALLDALHDRGSYGFTLSQTRCPVGKTGGLKRSGSVTNTFNNSTILYSAKYASNIERGIEAHTEEVSGYRSGNKTMSAYTRRVKPKEGVHFIETSLKESFEDFANKIDASLRVHFSIVTRR